MLLNSLGWSILLELSSLAILACGVALVLRREGRGRFRLFEATVVTTEGGAQVSQKGAVLKIDTATGAVWRLESLIMAGRSCSGWSRVSDTIPDDLALQEKARKLVEEHR